MLSTDDATAIVHRSGAAARRANLAPATLRVWERRYSVVDPQRSPSGQRLYSETDVKRLKLLKRLVDRGYAIGTVARLSLEQLEFLTHAAEPSAPAIVRATPRWTIVGKLLGERLKQLTPSLRIQNVYDGLPAIVERPPTTDIVVIHSPSLRDDAAETILSFSLHHSKVCFAVIYSFGIASAVNTLRRAGVRLYRDPMNRTQLAQMVDELSQTPVSSGARSDEANARPARLFSDRELGVIERQVSSVTCECPSHLTTLISQLAAFEAYSDGCSAQNASDADLHRQMGDAASQARTLLESLLQRVALLEGWSVDATA